MEKNRIDLPCWDLLMFFSFAIKFYVPIGGSRRRVKKIVREERVLLRFRTKIYSNQRIRDRVNDKLSVLKVPFPRRLTYKNWLAESIPK